MSVREVKESPLEQGSSEVLAYILETKYDSSGTWTLVTPASCTNTLLEWPSETDKSSTLLSGSVSIGTNNVTSKTVSGLTAGKTYRLYFTWVYGGLTYDDYTEIRCKR